MTKKTKKKIRKLNIKYGGATKKSCFLQETLNSAQEKTYNQEKINSIIKSFKNSEILKPTIGISKNIFKTYENYLKKNLENITENNQRKNKLKNIENLLQCFNFKDINNILYSIYFPNIELPIYKKVEKDKKIIVEENVDYLAELLDILNMSLIYLCVTGDRHLYKKSPLRNKLNKFYKEKFGMEEVLKDFMFSEEQKTFLKKKMDKGEPIKFDYNNELFLNKEIIKQKLLDEKLMKKIDKEYFKDLDNDIIEKRADSEKKNLTFLYVSGSILLLAIINMTGLFSAPPDLNVGFF